MNQEKFDIIKSYQRRGNSYQDIARIIGLSTTTVFYAMKANTLEDYKKRANTPQPNKSGTKKSRYRVTPENFALIKKLCSTLSQREISDLVNLSRSTIQTIAGFDTYHQYRDFVDQRMDKLHTVPVETESPNNNTNDVEPILHRLTALEKKIDELLVNSRKRRWSI